VINPSSPFSQSCPSSVPVRKASHAGDPLSLYIYGKCVSLGLLGVDQSEEIADKIISQAIGNIKLEEVIGINVLLEIINAEDKSDTVCTFIYQHRKSTISLDKRKKE